jgi:hypothetical protein
MFKTIIVSLGVFVIVVGAVILPTFIQGRNRSSANSCINNLRQLDGAMQQWALETGKGTDDVATWEDVRRYVKQLPVCPDGGTYKLLRLSEPPRCSLGGASHSLPAYH